MAEKIVPEVAPELARAAHAWPFEEARKVLARLERREKRGLPRPTQ